MRKTFKVDGIIFVEAVMIKTKLVVRYTADEIGKSLSIADEHQGVMFQIPFDKIYEQIKEV